MILSLVVAAANNNVIGKDNQLLWRLPNDMRFFKNITWAMPVIMGRKTFESLPEALKGRKNIVLSRQSVEGENAIVVKSVEDALFLVKQMDVKEAMVIGGGEIYKLFFEKASRIYLTRVEADLEGDTYFPDIDPQKWTLIQRENHKADDKHAYDYSFQIWERK